MDQETALRGRLGQRAALALSCLVIAACGGRAADGGSVARTTSTTARSSPGLAPRVCRRAASAAGARLHFPVATRIPDTDPAYLECILDGRGVQVDVVAQAIAQALGDYDTTLIHVVQAYIYPNGNQGRDQLPYPIGGIGTKAAWIPGQQKLYATNGTPDLGGNFLTITVTGRLPSDSASLALARAIAVATLAVAPRGPNLRSEH